MTDPKALPGTRAQWLEIARRVAIGNHCLCPTFLQVTGSSELYSYHGWDADTRMWRGAKYLTALDDEGANVRCLLACLFAAMTDAERREVLNAD